MSIPVFITCRDRVACLAVLVDRLEMLSGIGPIVLVDNDSAWPPMVDYLAATPHQVVNMGTNAGHLAVWQSPETAALRRAGPFVVTDPDVVPDENCPADLITRLADLLDEYPKLVKAGLGLRIDDLPDGSDLAVDVKDWESQFWEHELAPGLFEADIDTTFALYRAGSDPAYGPAVRTGAPYVARHLPWYADPESPDAEEIFYRARARPDSTNWHVRDLEPPLAMNLARRRRALQGWPDHPLLDAWAAEPALRDETEFTPWASAGWESWNAMAPERDFCEFAGFLVRLLQPGSVVETGVGQGYTTRRIAHGLARGGTLTCFESDDELRRALAALPFFAPAGPVQLSPEPTPSFADYERADLTVLGADLPGRDGELETWRAAAQPGSVLLVHDCGNGHPADTVHVQIRGVVEGLDVPGVFFRNPRGAFLGIHPGAGPHGMRVALAQARQEAADARTMLEAVHASTSWRITRPLRDVGRSRLWQRYRP